MRVRNRRVHAAGVVSVALVAVARVARDARPTRRVTCVRVPQGAVEPRVAPVEKSEPPVTALPEIASASSELAPALVDANVAVRDWSVPPFPFEDIALWQPTEVMDVVVVEEEGEAEAEVEPKVIAAAEAGPEAPIEPMAVTAAEGVVAPVAKSAPEPELTAAPAPELSAASALTTAPTTPPPPTPTTAPDPDPTPPHDPWGWAEPWVFEVPAAGTSAGRGQATARSGGRRGSRRRRGRHHEMIALAVIVIAVAISVWIAVRRSPSASARPTETADVSLWPHPSAYALRTIPGAYLRDYWKAADEYGLDWTKLAAVGQIESDQGRSETPGVAAGTNKAGAAGPAQFLETTWARYGVDADGRGSINPYDPADAITAMAAYLKASGAPENWASALFTYNHSTAYVNAVVALSRRYLAS